MHVYVLYGTDLSKDYIFHMVSIFFFTFLILFWRYSFNHPVWRFFSLSIQYVYICFLQLVIIKPQSCIWGVNIEKKATNNPTQSQWQLEEKMEICKFIFGCRKASTVWSNNNNKKWEIILDYHFIYTLSPQTHYYCDTLKRHSRKLERFNIMFILCIHTHTYAKHFDSRNDHVCVCVCGCRVSIWYFRLRSVTKNNCHKNVLCPIKNP